MSIAVDSFLPESTAARVEQISIETDQLNLDLATLDGLGDKTVIFGGISMSDEHCPNCGALLRRRHHVSPKALDALVAPEVVAAGRALLGCHWPAPWPS